MKLAVSNAALPPVRHLDLLPRIEARGIDFAVRTYLPVDTR